MHNRAEIEIVTKCRASIKPVTICPAIEAAAAAGAALVAVATAEDAGQQQHPKHSGNSSGGNSSSSNNSARSNINIEARVLRRLPQY